MKGMVKIAFIVVILFVLVVFFRQEFIFVPNAVLVKKPIPIEVIQTQSRLDQVLKTKRIVDFDYATLGAGLRLQNGELFLIKAQALKQEYYLTPTEGLGSSSRFMPQYLGKRYPLPVMLLKNQKEVNLVKKTPKIYKYQEAQIGAVVSLSLDERYLNLIPKNIVDKDYETPVNLRAYLREVAFRTIEK